MDLKDLIERETGQRFNKSGFICCPFHDEKTPSFKVKRYNDKDRYYCFGCGAKGDNIDFVKNYKNMTYIEACNYLGIELDTNQKEIYTNFERVEKEAKQYATYKKYTFIRMHTFVDVDNKILYYKAIYKDNVGTKQGQYFHIKDNKIEYSRGCGEVPYNYYRLVKGLEKNRHIYIVEGEKDADTLSHYGYTATSFKGVTEFNYSIFKDAIVYIIPDNDETGDKYKESIYTNLKDYVKEFNVIRPESFRNSRKGYDITDWFEDNHDIEDFKREVKDAWDYKKSRLWKYTHEVKHANTTKHVPEKVWQNLEILLNREKVNLKFNEISKGVECTGSITSEGEELLTDICTLSRLRGLNLSKQDCKDAILKIALVNKYNPFIDYLQENRNNDYSLIDSVFDCLEINKDFINNKEFYKTLFVKWLLNVVRQAHNTLEKAYSSQGVLVLQGEQGAFKSTFFKDLVSNHNFFKGDQEIDPSDKDSIKQNTKYVIVEIGELDATLKHDQAKLKAFITKTIDEYRVPYASVENRTPRITTYCATVNDYDFLRDKSGSRRFWVIPIEKCNIDKLHQIDIGKFWGSVYDLWLSNTVDYYLTSEETQILNNKNTSFNMETDISILIDETFDFTQDRNYWKTYSITELCEILDITKSKSLKNEMTRRNYKYTNHRDRYNGGQQRKSYLLPNTDKDQFESFKKAAANSPFINNEPIQEEIKAKPITWNTARA